jgi:SdpC family antimicrobial peptide
MKFIRKKLKFFSVFSALTMLLFSCSQYDDMNSDIDNSSNTNEKISYSGKEIFKSVFFGMGKFGNKIDLLRDNATLASNLNDSKKVEVNNKINKLLESIENNNSNFFNDFKSKIASGNHILIEKALQEGSLEIKKNIDIFFPHLSKQISAIENDIAKRNLNFESIEEMNQYVENIQNGDLNNDLLNQNMITSDGSEEVIGEAASLVWAVAAAVYFAVAVHNTIGVTALIYYKAAFWGPKIKSASIEQYRGVKSISQDNILKTEILIDQIANYGITR